jgi:site-specific recombinase XerD
MRPPTAKTIAETAEVVIKGAHDGTILDRGGKPYKPSTARGYEQLLSAYVVPALGGWELTQIQRRDVQDFVDGVRSQGLSPSSIANILDPLRVIFRRAIRRDEVAVDPTENLDLPAIRGRRDRIEPPEAAHELLAALPDTGAFFASTIRARANTAWLHAGLEPITPHEARHCAISYFIAAGLDWKQISTWAGHGDVRQTWSPYGHLVPAARTKPASASTAISPRPRRPRLWRTPPRRTKPPQARGF